MNFLKRKKRTLRKEHDAGQNNGGGILCEIQHTNQEIENQKAKIRSEQEKLRADKRRLQQLKNQQRIQKEIELDR